LIRYKATPQNSAVALNPLIVDNYRTWNGQELVGKSDDYTTWRRNVHENKLKSFNTTKYPVWTGYGYYRGKQVWPVNEDESPDQIMSTVWTHNEQLKRAHINHTVNVHWIFEDYSVIYTPQFNTWYKRYDYNFTTWLDNFKQISSLSDGGAVIPGVGEVINYVGSVHDPHGCRAQRVGIAVEEIQGKLAGVPMRWQWTVPLNFTRDANFKIEQVIHQSTWLDTIIENDDLDVYNYEAMIPSTVEKRTNFNDDFHCLWTKEHDRYDILSG
jgi:hypothetical protein